MQAVSAYPFRPCLLGSSYISLASSLWPPALAHEHHLAFLHALLHRVHHVHAPHLAAGLLKVAVAHTGQLHLAGLHTPLLAGVPPRRTSCAAALRNPAGCWHAQTARAPSYLSHYELQAPLRHTHCPGRCRTARRRAHAIRGGPPPHLPRWGTTPSEGRNSRATKNLCYLLDILLIKL